MIKKLYITHMPASIDVVPAAACIKVRCLLLLLAVRPAATTAAATKMHTAAVTRQVINVKENRN